MATKKAAIKNNTFIAKWTNEVTGDDVEKTVQFNAPNVRLKNSSVVDAELFVKVANGYKLSKKEAEDNPILVKLSKDDAANWLTQLVQIRYGHLEEVQVEPSSAE